MNLGKYPKPVTEPDYHPIPLHIISTYTHPDNTDLIVCHDCKDYMIKVNISNHRLVAPNGTIEPGFSNVPCYRVASGVACPTETPDGFSERAA